MRPNLRSLVAKAYRVRQGRTFSFSSSSSAPNPIDNKGKELDLAPMLDTLSNIGGWFLAGYTVEFGWETWALYKSKQRSDVMWELYNREMTLYNEELNRRFSQE